MEASEQRPIVASYYATLTSTSDLRTSACCPVDAVPPAHRAILARLHPTVLSRFYGCGSPIPTRLSGCVLLDLGCGTGRDAFLAAALAGPDGKVIGVDMTDEQLQVARDTAQFHADAFFGKGAKPNTDFRKGYIEDLKSADIADHSVDVVISNCVCNLSTDKTAVFAEVFRVLKEGGELYFSDVYADRRLSEEARRHPTLVAECLGGALYIEDFRRIMAEVGFRDVRVVTTAPIDVHDDELRKLVPSVQFHSITVRAFKIEQMEDRRESYGQIASYTSCCGDGFTLDNDFSFAKGTPVSVDANTAAILTKSRFADLFAVTGAGAHRGLFAPQEENGALARAVYGRTQQQEKSGGCCAPAAPKAEEQQGGGCCAPVTKNESEAVEGNGCCAPADVVEEPKAKSKGCGAGSACC